MEHSKSPLTFAEQKELVDHAFAKSKEHTWWTLRIIVPGTLLFLLLTGLSIYVFVRFMVLA